jgi:hypothetical protein
MAARLSALRVGRFLPPGRFLALIFVRRWVDLRAIVRLEGLGKLKKSTSSGIQTGDLPACSIVPQPTTLLRAPDLKFRVEDLSSRYEAEESWPQGLKIGHVGKIYRREKTAYYIKNSPARLDGSINQKTSICNFSIAKHSGLNTIIAVGRCIILITYYKYILRKYRRRR